MSPFTSKRKKSDSQSHNLSKNTRLKLMKSACLENKEPECVNTATPTSRRKNCEIPCSSSSGLKGNLKIRVPRGDSTLSCKFQPPDENSDAFFNKRNSSRSSVDSRSKLSAEYKACVTQSDIDNTIQNKGECDSLPKVVKGSRTTLSPCHGEEITNKNLSTLNQLLKANTNNDASSLCLKKKPLQESRVNVIHFLDDVTRGIKCRPELNQSLKSPLVRSFDELRPYKIVSPFDRRVTAITWHPQNPHIVAAGSKGGEIIFWNIKNPDDDLFIPGIGPGGSVCAMKFHPDKPTFVYTASITGKVMLQDFYGKNSHILLDTFSFENWFCSLDILHHQNMLMTGDCNGFAYLIDPDGNMLWTKKKKLHRNKISHIEFCPGYQHLVVTASIDHSVKIWDMRMLKNETSALHCFSHEKGVNSAHFSLLNGASLLTTDQRNELRVYTAPLWNLERIIPHPHRQFQHLTPIKACWHPLEDIAVVGRYPDDNFCPGEKRAIDFFDGHSGKLLYQMWNPDLSGIVSLNHFNTAGDTLASGMGFHLIIWKATTEHEKSIEKLLRSFSSISSYTDNSQARRRQHRRKDQKNEKKSKTTIQTKKK